MSVAIVEMPTLGPNEDRVLLRIWLKDEGDRVRSGESVCEVETTKAVSEVAATGEGYLVRLVEAGTRTPVGSPIAAITTVLGEEVESKLAASRPAAAEGEQRRFTRKAELLAKRSGIDLDAVLRTTSAAVVGEAEVEAFLRSAAPRRTLPRDAPDADSAKIERVMILGGFTGGAVLIVDSLATSPWQIPVGILDSNPNVMGRSIMGVPVVGSTDDAERLWRDGAFDAVVIGFSRRLDERAALFERLKAAGVPFTNVIDQTADIRHSARLGVGNVLLASVHVGPAATLGDNNFLSTFVCIEHDCVVGSHCAFGPSVSLSGRVTLGDRIRFGTGIVIEPDLTVGSDATIASGVALTSSVPPGSLVRAHISHSMRAPE